MPPSRPSPARGEGEFSVPSNRCPHPGLPPQGGKEQPTNSARRWTPTQLSEETYLLIYQNPRRLDDLRPLCHLGPDQRLEFFGRVVTDLGADVVNRVQLRASRLIVDIFVVSNSRNSYDIS